MMIAGSRWTPRAAQGVPAHIAALLRSESGAGVLVLTDARRAASMRTLAPYATVLSDAASLEGMYERFDAALIDGLLEDEPWDRWLLQRVHRMLYPDAPLVVVVCPLTSLASALDARFFAYACGQGVLRLARRLRPQVDLPVTVHRRYHLPRLMRKLESVGFTAIQAGCGWTDTTSPAARAWFARRATVVARKGSSLPGLRGRAWPPTDAHAERHAELYGSLSAPREAWLAAFPELHHLKPRALEPSECRDASVLVLAPHPDDELIGCGGTLCRMLSAGAKAAIFQATDGSRLESLRDLPHARRKTIRLDEARRVAEAMGAALVCWRQEDGRLRCTGQTVGELARVLDDLRPTHVFTPFVGDPHADHRVLSRILGEALGVARAEPQVLQYEVWSLVPANLYCDITGEIERLESLLLLYERAMRVKDFVHLCASRNLSRARELTGQPGYVEAFLCSPSAEYRRLVDQTPWPSA